MSNNKSKGIIYYKLEDRYDGDTTKYCGLTGGEIDSNFNFLRGYDIDSVTFNEDEGHIIFKRVNGDDIILKDYIKEKEIKLNFKLYSGDSVVGNGYIENPINVSDTLRNGFFAPVDSFIDLTIESNELPNDIEYGTRYLTKENISKYGLLYNKDGVNEISKILEEESSLWHVPTDEEWYTMLNAIEKNNIDRNHNTLISNSFNGKVAGAILKKGCFKWVNTSINETSKDINIKPYNNILPNPTFNEYKNTINNEVCYEIEVEENGVSSYYEYKCINLWIDNKNVTPTSEILESSGFEVYPVGIADEVNYSNQSTFGKITGFWSSSMTENTDVWSRIFRYDSDKVLHQAESSDSYLSLRLVREYHDNVQTIEIINGVPYKTILMPFVETDKEGNVIKEGKRVWTVENVSFHSLLNHDFGKYALKPTDEDGVVLHKQPVYFINFWNGTFWEKRLFTNNDMVVIKNGPDGSHDNEWQLINDELYLRSQEIIEELKKFVETLIGDVYENFRGEINDLNKKVDENKNSTDTEISQLKDNVNSLFETDEKHSEDISILDTKINTEISERKSEDDNLKILILNGNEFFKNVIDNEKKERIANDIDFTENNIEIDAIEGAVIKTNGNSELGIEPNVLNLKINFDFGELPDLE